MSAPNARDYEVAEGLVDAWETSGKGYGDLSERIAAALAEARDRATGATMSAPEPPIVVHAPDGLDGGARVTVTEPGGVRWRGTVAGPWFQARCDQCDWFEEVPFQAREDADAATARHTMREHSPKSGQRA